MSESPRTVTRREILKRGAIVGGGVLWVTPVVQTLGMGPAFATAVSGTSPDPCKMTLTKKSCSRRRASVDEPYKVYLGFDLFVADGCVCGPSDSVSAHSLALFVDGKYAVALYPYSGAPGLHSSGVVLDGPAKIDGRCVNRVRVGVDWVLQTIAQTDEFDFTLSAFNACTADAG